MVELQVYDWLTINQNRLDQKMANKQIEKMTDPLVANKARNLNTDRVAIFKENIAYGMSLMYQFFMNKFFILARAEILFIRMGTGFLIMADIFKRKHPLLYFF